MSLVATEFHYSQEKSYLISKEVRWLFIFLYDFFDVIREVFYNPNTQL